MTIGNIFTILFVTLSLALCFPAGAQDSVADTILSVTANATFIRTNNDYAAGTVPISLSGIGLNPLDYVLLQRLGDYDNGPGGDIYTSMFGVFSSNDTLLNSSLLHRVPGAIDAGVDFTSSNTWNGDLPTDIPEDFRIDSTIIQIPDSARFLFVAVHDSKYDDNTDPDGDLAVRIAETVAPNRSPVALDDTFYVAHGDTVLLDLLRNDIDPDRDSIYIAGIIESAEPAHLIFLEDGILHYAAIDSQSLADSFTYILKNTYGDSTFGNVMIYLKQGLSTDMHTVTLFKFEEAYSLAAFDYSMNNNHGQNTGTAKIPGPFGYAMYFDGIDDYVDMDRSRVALDSTAEWTLEFLARSAESETGAPGLINHSCGNGWVLVPSAGAIAYGIKTDAAGDFCDWIGGDWKSVATPAPIDTFWHYLALTFKSNDSLRVYMDGMLLGGMPVSGMFTPVGSSSYAANIGLSDYSDSYYKGYVDEVRVSNRARETNEIYRTWKRMAPALGQNVTDISGKSAALSVAAFSLYPNYPNPFNPVTTIIFQIPKSEFTLLKVYNILGKEVATLVSGNLNPGMHTYRFDGGNLASGVYFYKITAGEMSKVRKMLLLR